MKLILNQYRSVEEVCFEAPEGSRLVWVSLDEKTTKKGDAFWIANGTLAMNEQKIALDQAIFSEESLPELMVAQECGGASFKVSARTSEGTDRVYWSVSPMGEAANQAGDDLLD